MEVEVLQRLVVLEVRTTDSLLQLLAVASFDLVGEESKQKLLVRQTCSSFLKDPRFPSAPRHSKMLSGQGTSVIRASCSRTQERSKLGVNCSRCLCVDSILQSGS